MKKTDIETIIWQEWKIKNLSSRIVQLESGYIEICKQNEKLRSKIQKMELNENKLSSVNV